MADIDQADANGYDDRVVSERLGGHRSDKLRETGASCASEAGVC